MRYAITVIATVAVFFVSSAANAEDIDCAELSPSMNGHGARAVQCVAELTRKLDAALARIKALEATAIPAVGSHPETTAIIAYYAQKGERACPEGWSLFEPAKDRMLVGAGGKYQYPGEIGGSETVTLTEAQMPAHNHGGALVIAGTTLAGMNNDYAYHNSGAPVGLPISGGGQPHPNMPPYIALYFCKRD